jgi:1,6-anhydro-N-acetylmuramate kinase
MADTVTLEFLGRQMERMLARQDTMQDDIRVLTAIALRHENTLKDVLGQVRAMVAQHQRSATVCGGSRTNPRISVAA